MSTSLRFEPYVMPAANLGPNNPLPDIRAAVDIHSSMGFDDTIPPEDRASFTYGRVSGILPYMIQDGYDRDKKPRAFNSVVLENGHLKAIFIPELGGRLWSLFDKDAGRELLHVNPVFQPANLALRNAWISGGVEWNIGMIGHTPLTVSPLFASTYEMADGTPVLRMYEWERIRRAAYQVEAFLPEWSKFLFVRVQIQNTQDEEVPMYWWSNIAVNEADGVRVLAPATQAFAFDYTRKLSKQDVPEKDGIDRSYTRRVPHAMDLFFDIAKTQRKWECAVDEGGYGLLHASTDRQRGRKLFMWGNSAGGKRWQEFLAAPGHAYLEIQAGVAQTQMQCLPMPARAKWDWLEGYGALSADPKAAHGEWTAAYAAVTEALDGILPMDVLNGELERARRAAMTSPEPIRLGSGWAALEAARLAASGEAFDVGELAFPESSMGEEQRPWLELLRTGAFPTQCPRAEPASYMIQPEWLALLEKSVKSGASDHWCAWLHLGVMYWKNGEQDRAWEAFERSNALERNAWALRNMAAMKTASEDTDAAVALMLEAAQLLKQVNLVLECGKLLITAQKYGEFAEFHKSLPEEFLALGRIRVMDIEASINLGEFEHALAVFADDLTVNDVREGEVLLSNLWVQLHKKMMEKDTPGAEIEDKDVLAKYPLPASIDFRMRT